MLHKSPDGAPGQLTHLVHTVRHHSKLPSEALRGVGLRTVFGQLALILVADGRLLGDGGTAKGLEQPEEPDTSYLPLTQHILTTPIKNRLLN